MIAFPESVYCGENPKLSFSSLCKKSFQEIKSIDLFVPDFEVHENSKSKPSILDVIDSYVKFCGTGDGSLKAFEDVFAIFFNRLEK